jgi:hypothetical protein
MMEQVYAADKPHKLHIDYIYVKDGLLLKLHFRIGLEEGNKDVSKVVDH